MSFDDFYIAFHEKTLQYLQYKGLQKSDAEDLCSQVFLYCFQHYHDFDPQKASIISWLFLITRSRLKNFWRDRKNDINIEDLLDVIPDYDNNMERALMLDQLRQQVSSALLELPERQRIIVVLRYYHDMGAKDIGLRLGMTPGSVRVQLSRALDKLELALRDEVEETSIYDT